MRVVIVGFGVQGRKRLAAAGSDAAGVVDPVRPEAVYRDVREAPLGSFDAAMVCTPDGAKFETLSYLLAAGKHVLVEKPLIDPRGQEPLERLAEIAARSGAVCYTAYNHRFEPHFMRMKALLDSGELGKIYRCRMFYGNGTARDVRNSVWRDEGAGVLPDLGSHLLDTALYWFGEATTRSAFRAISANRFENRAFDHVTVGAAATAEAPELELEMTLLSWRNHFTCDVFAENGSAHIESLCKWGPSVFTRRLRKLPSGRPDEEATTLVRADPTWDAEYAYFKALCAGAGTGNIGNDLWINRQLNALSAAALESNPA
jgi:scyllo-inositol 2-dehydrogenase (NADP+)